MTGDDVVRHCRQCDKNVYNLSALSADAAANLFREREGKICVRFYRRSDGTMLTEDCPVGRQRHIRRGRLAVLATSLAGLISLPGCGRDEKPIECVMGEAPPIEVINTPELLPPPREVQLPG
jgi:hypothetical protein